MKISKHPYYTKYHTQKSNAGKRGIAWHFTFASWLDWWGADLPMRGKGGNKLCMARHGDQGPYSASNCYKATYSQNIRESYETNPNRGKNVSLRNAKLKAKPVQTPDGVFPSLKAAAEYYNITTSSMWQRVKKHSDKYFYI